MEPTSITAPRGTLEDPEILRNVPGHVIPVLQREFDDFKTEATRFLAGDTPEAEFIKFRLKQGVYGQRQADVQMLRVKLPFGGITPEQLEMFADVIERYAARQTRVLRTDLDGAIALKFSAQGIAAEGYRSQYRRYWQSPLSMVTA